MNIHFQQAENKSEVLFYMLVVVVAVAISMLMWNASRTSQFHLAVLSSSAGQPADGEMNNMPVAVPAPLPLAEQLAVTTTPIPSVTPNPLPQAVAVPVPNLP